MINCADWGLVWTPVQVPAVMSAGFDQLTWFSKPLFPPLLGGTYFMGWLSVGDGLSLEPDREGELNKYLFLIKDEKFHSLRAILTYQQKIGKKLHFSQAKNWESKLSTGQGKTTRLISHLTKM